MNEITVIRPTDPGYDERRLGFQAHRTQHPAGIVAARSADDVAAAVRLARREARPVSVQATGHGVGAVDPDAILVDTSALRGVRVDPAVRTARAEAGARWGDVIAAAAPHGLAPLSGSTPAVGVVGYLLAGGVPLLGRRYGFAAAGVRSFEVVTATGERRTVAASGDGLGWALRGGGGSFAVVTAVTVELIELRTVFGGSLTFSATPELVRGWRDWAAALPEHAGTALALLPGATASVRVVVDGPAEDGERLVAPLRDWDPNEVLLRELPWTDSGEIWNDPSGPVRSVSTNLALGALPDTAVDAVLDTVGPGEILRIAELRRLGGAFTRPTGLPLRHDAEWSVGVISAVETGPESAAHARDAELHAALAPVTVGRLASFLFGEGADPAAVRSAYDDASWAKLRQIRQAVDPDGVFAAGSPIT